MQFSRTELNSLLGVNGARDILLHLGIRAVDVPPNSTSAGRQPLLLRPLVLTGTDVIVACPHALLAATVRRVLKIAQEQGQSERLDAFIQQTNVERVDLALHRLDAPQLNVSLSPPMLPGSQHSIHLLDAELLLHVIVVTEPVSVIEPAEVVGLWALELPDLHPTLPSDLPSHDVLTLLVAAHLGDTLQFSLPAQEPTPFLLLELDDLETFASAYHKDPVALLRVHQSQQALKAQLDVRHFGPLDVVAYCCKAQMVRSFPFPEGQLLILGPGPSSQWRRDVKEARDRHLVLWADQEMLIPIERAWDAPPGVYVPVVSPWSRGAMAAEREDRIIWVLDGTGELSGEPDEGGAPFSTPVDQVAQALAVWLPRLLPLLPSGRRPVMTLVIHPPQEVQPREFGVQVDRKRNTAHLALSEHFIELLSQPDNAAERELLAVTTHILFELASNKPPAPDRIREVVDQLAPPGDARLIFSVQTAMNAELDPRDLTQLRLVQVSEWHANQVRVGRALAAEHHWIPGPITALNRQVMAQANTLLFTDLRNELTACHGPELLSALLALYESVRHDIAWLSHTGVARQHTHGQAARHIEGRHHRTSTALRFLIELVVAEPPSGARPPSLLLIDRLIGTAVAIIEYGMVGDALQHELGTVTAEYGLDGAFRVQAHEYAEAATAQATSFLARSMHMENRLRYRDPDLAAQQADTDSRLEVVDDAFRNLYGLSFRDLMGFLNEVQNLGDDLGGGVTRMSLPEFLSVLSHRTGWPEATVKLALHPLTMWPRADFLAPPAPYLKSDVYPWQFNRELALTRRPLLLVPGAAGEDIVWGNRVVEGAKHYWAYSLVGDGRLAVPPSAATSKKKAQRALQSLRETSAAAFNRTVADLCRSRGCDVWENVRKISSRRLITPTGDDLGDVDVLAINTRQRCVWVVECKNYSIARTPAELANDLEVLIRGKQKRRGGQERPLIERHQRRAEFVRDHLSDVLQLVSETNLQGWTVRALVVMSAEPFALMRSLSTLPLLSADELDALLQQV
ncbi:hypothetical protein [Deinococcus sp. 23YEL01]|uniref:hypothetical protein n=1 Tax=Deinococcus sp. 23YEL01 TaxID=2745871 RepID=UPI001E2D7A63|nr:hypothetical protein [Deinococcus sp. 23YEL01]MCD0169055.1 hypothetical protein [Deinococcus sp. 23YEL01]